MRVAKLPMMTSTLVHGPRVQPLKEIMDLAIDAETRAPC